jgi:hypothetical protein
LRRQTPSEIVPVNRRDPSSGGRALLPYRKSVLAEGKAELGDLAAALDLVDQAIAQVERPGWEERYYCAEILRIKGWLLSLIGGLPAPERAYCRLARLGAAAAGEILGAADRDQLRAADARPGSHA